MKTLKTVDPKFINQLWDVIGPFYERSAATGNGDCTADQLRLGLVNGWQTVFIVEDADGTIVGSFAVELVNTPNHRVAHTTAMGGKGLFDRNIIDEYETWARMQGCTKIRAWAKDGQARLYRMKLGLQITTNVVEKLL
jgi:hypothetical protein